MGLTIREARPADAPSLGRICHDAFAAIAGAHNFPKDFPNEEIATLIVGSMISSPGFYGVVAEQDGKIIGSNFLDERSPISGVGPITVEPGVQNDGAGALLMKNVMDRSDAKKFPGIRLVQAGYHCRSLALYAKLGFEIREHLTCMQGTPIGKAIPGYPVRAAVAGDLAACNALCSRVHGHDRNGELRDAILQGSARVVERFGRITGYTSQIAFSGHAVGETTDDVKALIATATAFVGPGFLVPSRNGELMRWCFANGLRMIQPLTLMTRGLYNEPAGAYLPSVIY